MIDRYHAFLVAVDEHLRQTLCSKEKIDLYQIGGSAVIMNYGMQRTTKDFDVIINTPTPIWDDLTQAFGKESTYAQQNEFYLEVVISSLPNVPEGYRQRCVEVPGNWEYLRLWKLEVHDFIVTKLRRFNSQDRKDISYICDREPIKTQTLRDRLDSAFGWYYKDDAYQEGPRKNLERVIEYLDGKITTI